MEGVFIMNKKWNIDNIRCFVEKETNCKLISTENLAIEYDGEQHFKPIKYFGGKDKLKKQIKNDVRKNYYCASHNIKLIRIPYWKFDKINTILEDAIM